MDNICVFFLIINAHDMTNNYVILLKLILSVLLQIILQVSRWVPLA